MDFYGCHFEYAGELSRKYGLIIANIETDRNTKIAGKSKSVSIFNKRNNVKYDLGNTYDDAPLTFDMEVISEDLIEGEWRRKIQKWLFNQNGYKRLYVDQAESLTGETFELVNGVPKRFYLNCKFVNPEIIEGNGGIVGYKFSVECDSRMAWQEPMTLGFTYTGGENQTKVIEIVLDTDCNDYTYPKFTVTTGEVGGQIEVANITDNPDRKTIFASIPPETKFILNGIYNYVSDGYYENFIDRNFPRFLDGTNQLSIKGDIASLEIEWQNMRYL